MPLSAQAFDVLRRAVRLARDAGFVWTRNSDAGRMLSAPSDGPYSGAGAFAPYWAMRAGSLGMGRLESFETTPDEREAFALDDDDLWVTPLGNCQFEFSAEAVETLTCENCEEPARIEDHQTVFRAHLNDNVVSRHRWCEDCTSEGATYIENEDETWADSSIVLFQDTDERVSIRRAREDGHRHNDGYWYSPDHDCDAYYDGENSEELGEEADICEYGTNIIGMYGWPANNAQEALVFGVELEVEPFEYSDEAQCELANALGGRKGFVDKAFILAGDGSLTHGVEIITQPQTLEQHHTGALVPWREISKRLQAAKARSGAGTENCGMHVHINKAALSALTVGKMLVLINSDSMRGLVETVAQRSANNYAQRKAKKITDALGEGEHYDALNIGTEHDTLELRIFRGNTRHSRIMKNIEFAHALCIYCRDASMLEVTQPEKMRAWIAARASQYPNLSKFLTEHTED